MARRRRCALIFLLLPVVAAGCDWPQFLAGPAHTGADAGESTISAANVATLAERFSAPTGGALIDSTPVVAGGTVYVVSGDGDLYAFSASGASSCSGSPDVCTPLWKADAGGAPPSIQSSPAVANGVVYVAGGDGVLRAFDAAGKINCTGAPVTCTPLWTASVGVRSGIAPVVAGGTLYVDSATTGLVALDAAGRANCSGTPRVCVPLWRTYFDGFVSVANGRAYVVGLGGVQINVYDASGTVNCAGAPKVCSQLWQYRTNYALTGVAPDYAVVTGTTLYVEAATPFRQLPAHQDIEAFDAGGSTNCSAFGTLTVCTPLWTTSDVPGTFPPAVVANGDLYTGAENGIAAFDASGVAGCAGSPSVCTPRWTATPALTTQAPMAAANGLLFGTDGTRLFALDASGHDNCAAGVCGALWTATPGGPVNSGPVVANGFVYASAGNDIVAYGLPR